MLALAEVEEGHHSCFLVLSWVAFEDLLDEALILRCEFEWNGGVVVGGISVLQTQISDIDCSRIVKLHTTERASLEAGRVVENGRTCRNDCRGAARNACLTANGIILDAIAGKKRCVPSVELM